MSEANIVCRVLENAFVSDSDTCIIKKRWSSSGWLVQTEERM